MVLNTKNINKFYCSIKLVRSLLVKLPLNKSVGVDKLSAEHLCFCDPIINVYLNLYYNMCLKHGYIPSNCLDTVIIPTLKNINGNINDANNFRPISNPAIRDTFLCLLMPVPSPDKWGGLRQEGHPA